MKEKSNGASFLYFFKVVSPPDAGVLVGVSEGKVPMLPEIQHPFLMVGTEEQSHPKDAWSPFRHSRLDKPVYFPAAHASGCGLGPLWCS